ncbi:phage holin family protein [Streptomyces venezuelae]|uniref:phage holin family protein n=1 Tax=Streptomyces venezuelae TaxID=54571 RepID=UPI003451C8C9
MTGPENPLSGLDKGLTDELVRTIRAELREEFREQTRKQRRKATLYAASGAAALYAGAAVVLALGLVIDLGLPGWAAALIMAAVLGAAAFLLRNAARSGPGHDAKTSAAGIPGAEALPEPGGSGLTAPATAATPATSATPAAPPAPATAPTVPPGTPDTPDVPPMPPTAPPTGRAGVRPWGRATDGSGS